MAEERLVVSRAKDRIDRPERWAMVVIGSRKRVLDAIAAGDIETALRGMNEATQARAMHVFLSDVESSLWRGYQVGRMRDVLRVWQDNRSNNSEDFWQDHLSQHSYLLSQVFSLPMLLIEGKAYLGGKGLPNTGGKTLSAKFR